MNLLAILGSFFLLLLKNDKMPETSFSHVSRLMLLYWWKAVEGPPPAQAYAHSAMP